MRKYIVFILLGFLIVLNGCLGAVGFFRSKMIKELDNNFYLNGNKYYKIKYDSEFIDEGFNASLDDKNLNKYVIISSTLNTHEIGEYNIYYTFKYKGFTKTLQRHVSVIDNEMPSIDLKCDDDIYIEINGNFKECEYEASDKYDGNLKDKVVITDEVDISKEGDYKINYLVTDSSNNKVSKDINVHVRDKDKITYLKVIIHEQKIYYYVNNKLVLESPVTTGKNNYTKTGVFRIHNKVRNTYLKGANYTSFVKYWMAYKGNNYGLHDASWRSKFGTMDYKKNGSHGCVNLPTDTAEKLYDMVEIGTPLYILD